MFIAAAVLLGFIIVGVGVFMAMRHQKWALPGGGASPEAGGNKSDQNAVLEGDVRSEFSYLAEIETLAKKFLEATTVEEILPLIRDSAVTEARIREFYPDGKIEPVGMSQRGTKGRLVKRGKILVFKVTTGAQEKRQLSFIETPQGLKLDWESWVGWSSISWEKFLAGKPLTGHVFRVTLMPVDYYNFGFSDEVKWQSYRIESTDREHTVFGYIERSSEIDNQIRSIRGASSANIMLSLKFPEGSTSDNQVLIDRFVCDGWVENVESP